MLPRLSSPRAAAARRSGSGLLILLILALLLLYSGGRYLARQSAVDRGRTIRAATLDPRGALKQFFLERGPIDGPDSNRIAPLLAMTTRDDIQWYESNWRLIAVDYLRSDAQAPEPQLRYDALAWLVDLEHRLQQPVIVQTAVSADGLDAVAYWHPPGRADQMQPCGLENEGGYWKVARFLGRRDDPQLVQALIKIKQDRSLPLSDDEQAFMADPQGDAARRKAAMLQRVGLQPSR